MLHDSFRHPSKKLLSFEFIGDYVFNFEHVDILRDSIEHPSKKLLSFEFAQTFRIQF